jgi:hypothetical protein
MLKQIHHQFTSNKQQNSKWFFHALVQRMLALGYLHVTFPFNILVIPHLAKSKLLHGTKLKGNKCVIGFRELNHISIHPKVSITDGTYIKFNFVLLPIEET